jgi:hypothetical protein
MDRCRATNVARLRATRARRRQPLRLDGAGRPVTAVWIRRDATPPPGVTISAPAASSTSATANRCRRRGREPVASWPRTRRLRGAGPLLLAV